MNFYLFMFIILILGTMSLISKKKFLLSLIMTLEFLLLKSLTITIYTGLMSTSTKLMHVSVFMLALSAVEASMGVSMVSLLSRKLKEVSISSLSNLKS